MKTLCADLSKDEANRLYFQLIEAKDQPSLRRLCQEDLFFLITFGFKRRDLNRPWLYERCREVEANPNDHLDLWAREHYKSTIITYGKTIQDILVNPEETIGIFSHTRPIAKGFLEQIKRELEMNTFLQDLFPDVLYKEPKRESPRWSTDNGIIVKRQSNPKEATVEAWGLVDGQPTSKHFSILVYDDVVTRESVTTPEQIKKVTDAWALSLNLGAKNGKRRYIGTRYHANDTYADIIARNAALPRIYTPTDKGHEDFQVQGVPVLLTRAELLKKREEMGPYIFACQMLQNPQADKVMGFKDEWISNYDFLRNYAGWNFYILVDPAGEKKKTSDYTVMVVIGTAPDGNYYLVDGIRDRLNLTERARELFRLHRKWNPINTGYEKYGMQADIEHVKYEMEIKNYRFKITALGGQTSKNDRIRRLVPLFEQRRFWTPHYLFFVDREKKQHDFMQEFWRDEYQPFPVAVHDDMLDCVSRICDEDMQVQFPKPEESPYPSATMEHEVNTVQTEYKLFQ